jgi:hypothetical protein
VLPGKDGQHAEGERVTKTKFEIRSTKHEARKSETSTNDRMIKEPKRGQDRRPLNFVLGIRFVLRISDFEFGSTEARDLKGGRLARVSVIQAFGPWCSFRSFVLCASNFLI